MKTKVADALKNTPASYYIKSAYYKALKLKNLFLNLFSRRKIKNELSLILSGSDYKCIDLFHFRFGWSAGSFQRAQHIAYNMANSGVLVFYAKNPVREKTTEYFTKLFDNLYLIDVDNPVLMSVLRKELKKSDKVKFIHTCSTNIFFTRRILNSFVKDGYKVLYEYIDEISPELSGNIPSSFLSLHKYISANKQFYVVSSAKELYKKIAVYRGDNNHILAQNAVDYEHWQVDPKSYKKHSDISDIKADGKPVIGYFGALAKWFDYELLKYCAKTLPDYNFVLIGWQYDDSYSKNGISEYNNIKFLGSKDYSVLPEYITAFDVATIPFLINEITLSTSPVKLFEYLAAGKPALCTMMPECMDTPCVMIGKTHEEYAGLLKKAVSESGNPELIAQRKSEALKNTWKSRVEKILAKADKTSQ